MLSRLSLGGREGGSRGVGELGMAGTESWLHDKESLSLWRGGKGGGDKVGTTSSTSGGEFKEIALKAEFKVPETSVAGGVKGVFGVAGSGVPIVSDSSSLIREWINGANWKGFRVDVLCRLAKGLMPGDFSEYSVFLGNFLGCFSPRGSKSKDLLYK